MENQNRKRNLKNQRMDEQNKRWSAFKKAPGTQTSEKNSATKKGGNAARAQSSSEEEAPKQKKTKVTLAQAQRAAIKEVGKAPTGEKLAKEL